MNRGITRAGTFAVGVTLLLFVSCTRMPTPPPIEITISGRILGPDGSALPGVSVVFYPLEPGQYLETQETDSRGTYTVRLWTGTYRVRIDPRVHDLPDHEENVTFTRRSTRYDHSFTGIR